MAYTAVTYADFQARFPTLTDFTQTQVEAVLAEVANVVDDSWLSATDFKSATLYLTAHMLVLEDTASDKPAHLHSEGLGGGMSKSYDTANAEDLEGLLATEYGRRYLSLCERNFPGITAV